MLRAEADDDRPGSSIPLFETLIPLFGLERRAFMKYRAFHLGTSSILGRRMVAAIFGGRQKSKERFEALSLIREDVVEQLQSFSA